MSHPLANAFWIMLEFFVWIVWFMLLFRVIIDLLSDHDLGVWAKVLWLIFVILVPFLGVFVYLIVRGPKMSARAQKQAARSDADFKAYVRKTAGSGGTSHADELAKLASLRADGTLSEAEFQQAKSKVLTS
jgi:hypothetical protein